MFQVPHNGTHLLPRKQERRGDPAADPNLCGMFWVTGFPPRPLDSSTRQGFTYVSKCKSQGWLTCTTLCSAHTVSQGSQPGRSNACVIQV